MHRKINYTFCRCLFMSQVIATLLLFKYLLLQDKKISCPLINIFEMIEGVQNNSGQENELMIF